MTTFSTINCRLQAQLAFHAGRLWLLQSEALCAEAMRRTRLVDFADPPIEPALSILVNSLDLRVFPFGADAFAGRIYEAAVQAIVSGIQSDCISSLFFVIRWMDYW